jgi:hypothetical protein
MREAHRGVSPEGVPKSIWFSRERGWETYKPDSVPQRDASLCLDDHFSGIRVAPNLKRPTRRPRPGQPECRTRYRVRHVSSYLALHRATLTMPVMSPSPRWALTPPFHPYLSLSDQMGSHRLDHRRFDFCGAGVGLLRLGITQRPARGVRTFLPMREAPSDHPIFHPRWVSIKNEAGP